MEFAKKWVERPEVAEKIARDYPELKEASSTAKAMFALGDRTSFAEPHLVAEKKVYSEARLDILPPEFFHLRDISYATHTLLAGLPPHLGDEVRYEKGIKSSVQANSLQDEGIEKPYWTHSYKLFGATYYEMHGTEESFWAGSTTHPWVRRINPILRLERAQGAWFDPLTSGTKYLRVKTSGVSRRAATFTTSGAVLILMRVWLSRIARNP